MQACEGEGAEAESCRRTHALHCTLMKLQLSASWKMNVTSAVQAKAGGNVSAAHMDPDQEAASSDDEHTPGSDSEEEMEAASDSSSSSSDDGASLASQTLSNNSRTE